MENLAPLSSAHKKEYGRRTDLTSAKGVMSTMLPLDRGHMRGQTGECPFVPTTTHSRHTSFIPQQFLSSDTVFPGPDTVSLITTANIAQKGRNEIKQSNIGSWRILTKRRPQRKSSALARLVPLGSSADGAVGSWPAAT